MLHGGNTAMVAIQYSFLPSWIATLLADDASTEAGAVLFDTVYETWAQLPEDDRPELIIYGLSLGSYGAEAAFAGSTADNSIANLTARADGALLGGPTNDNEVWGQITDGPRRRIAGVEARVRRRHHRAIRERRGRTGGAGPVVGGTALAVRPARLRSR